MIMAFKQVMKGSIVQQHLIECCQVSTKKLQRTCPEIQWKKRHFQFLESSQIFGNSSELPFFFSRYVIFIENQNGKRSIPKKETRRSLTQEKKRNFNLFKHSILMQFFGEGRGQKLRYLTQVPSVISPLASNVEYLLMSGKLVQVFR